MNKPVHHDRGPYGREDDRHYYDRRTYRDDDYRGRNHDYDCGRSAAQPRDRPQRRALPLTERLGG